MLFQRLPAYPLSNLLHSDDGVAICQLDPDVFRNLICDMWGRYSHLVIEDSDGHYWPVLAADAIREGNLG